MDTRIYVRKVDIRDRVVIPKKVMECAGIKTGDYVAVFCHQDLVIIKKSDKEIRLNVV
ncbi:MAG: AbrB/MazE/SpoVT family DNA-binding domain-containing protein [Nitrososphaeria archaeon]